MKYKKYLTSGLICSLLLNNIGLISYAFNSPSEFSNSNFIETKDKKSNEEDLTYVAKPYKSQIVGQLLNNRINATSQIIDNKIYIIGGSVDNGVTPTNSLEIYDLDTNTSSLGTPMNFARQNLTSAIVDNKIYCFGGRETNSINSCSETVQIYDPITDSWTRGNNMPRGLSYFTATAVGDKIYCIGGRRDYGYSNSVYLYDTISNTWSTKTNMPTPRSQFSSFLFDNKIYCIGGYDSYTLDKTEIYDISTDTWSNGSTGLAFKEAICTVFDDVAYIFTSYGQIYIYYIKEDRWVRSYQNFKNTSNSTAVAYKGSIYMIGLNYYTDDVLKYTFEVDSPLVFNYADSFAGGDGSKDNPYQISSASELSRLSYLVNDKHLHTQNMYFELTNDIDFSDFDTDNSSYNGNWTPIGIRATTSLDETFCYQDYSFRGFFNGNGYSILNIDVKNYDIYNNLGFFGVIENAHISNLNLSNININEKRSSFYGCIGGLSGMSFMGSTISNVNIDGNIKGEDVGGLIGEMADYYPNYIDNCTTNVNITSSSGFYSAGGLIGYGANLVIHNSHSSGSLIVTENNDSSGGVGGLVGYMVASEEPGYEDIIFTIENSTSNMKIHLKDDNKNIGGFIGYFCGDGEKQSYIKNCHSYSEIILGSENVNIGGFVGFTCDDTTIENSYSTGFIKGDISEIGGFIGGGYSPIINNCYSLVNIEGALKVGGVIGTLEDNFESIKNYYYAGNINKEEANIIESSEFYPMIVTLTKTDTNLNDTDKNSNIYYDKDKINANINIQDLNIPRGLSTIEMKGKEAQNNMSLDYINIWKLNKEFYPTFEQLNSAPDIMPNDKVINSTITINQYDKFNPLDYVTIEDFEGDEVTTIIKEDIDTSKYGEFPITYIATDSKGLSSELTLNLKINPLMIKVNEAPVIIAEDITLTVGDEFKPLEVILVVDKEDGIITDNVNIIENTVNTSKPGIYKVTYEIVDKNGAKATKTITVTVKEKVLSNNNQSNSNTTDDEKYTNNNTTPKPQTSDSSIFINISLLIVSLVALLSINIDVKKYFK